MYTTAQTLHDPVRPSLVLLFDFPQSNLLRDSTASVNVHLTGADPNRQVCYTFQTADFLSRARDEIGTTNALIRMSTRCFPLVTTLVHDAKRV